MNRLHRLQVLRRFSSREPLKKAIKHESFVYKSFFGEFDKDYLKFPKFINVRDVDERYEKVRHEFKALSVSRDQTKLANSGFLDTKSFSTFELVRFFEAIGCSLNFKNSNTSRSDALISLENQLCLTQRFVEEYKEKKSFVQTILPILINNSLVLPALSAQDAEVSNFSAGFAFAELDEKFASLPYSFWKTTANYDGEKWILNGVKNRILKLDNDYEHFLVFCRRVGTEGVDDGLVAFLLSKNQVEVHDDGSDNYGNRYLKIEFNNLAVEVPATVSSHNEISAMNIKARGQLAVAALIYGIMKQILDNAVQEINKSSASTKSLRRSLATQNLSRITEMLFSLETCLYQTTAHFDAYDNEKLDVYLQAMVVKTLATEFANETLAICRTTFGVDELSRIFSNETSTVLNVLDSFLESSTSNRLLLAVNGLRAVGSWKFDHLIKLRLGYIYLIHFIKYSMFGQKTSEQRFPDSYEDLKALKKLNPALESSAAHLEKVLSQLKELSDHLLVNYGKEVVQHQIEMNRLASVALSVYQMTAVIGRTNDALNDASDQRGTAQQGDAAARSRIAHSCLTLCNQICNDHAISVQQNKDLIIGVLDTSEEQRSRIIHKRNLRFNGYFPASTFDRII